MFFTMQPSTLQMAQSCCRLLHTAGPRQFHGDGQSTLRVRRDLETVRVTVKFLQPRLGVRQTDTIAEGGKLAALESFAIVADFQSECVLVAQGTDQNCSPRLARFDSVAN